MNSRLTRLLRSAPEHLQELVQFLGLEGVEILNHPVDLEKLHESMQLLRIPED